MKDFKPPPVSRKERKLRKMAKQILQWGWPDAEIEELIETAILICHSPYCNSSIHVPNFRLWITVGDGHETYFLCSFLALRRLLQPTANNSN
jgi:hypothetical protein